VKLKGWNGALICKVSLKSIHTVGEQDGYKVYVGTQLMITSQAWKESRTVEGFGGLYT